MRLVNPGYTIETPIDGEKMLKDIERFGRTCYKSEDRITSDSAKKFVAMILSPDKRHESVLEHVSITVRVVCDRGVSHEIVRHRLAAYSQESTRYCNYCKDKFDNNISVIPPVFFDSTDERVVVQVPSNVDGWLANCDCEVEPKDVKANAFDVWFMAMAFSEWAYFTLVNVFGRQPQEARDVLPNSLKTEIVITYNLRQWRHFFRMRTGSKVHPQMREIVLPMLEEFKSKIPVIFDDIVVV